MDIKTAKQKLWGLMDINNLLPDEDDYYRIRNIINSKGRKRLDEIICLTGKEPYDEICSAYKQNFTGDDLARILGFGECLTEYLVYPLGLNAHEKEMSIKLGALANLVVTLFDTFIDNGKLPANILSEEVLKNLSLNRHFANGSILNIPNTPDAAAILALVREYFCIAEKIVSNGGNKGMKIKLVDLIISMYRSEVNTLDVKSLNDINNKSVLPFVVMGCGGLLWKDNAAEAEYSNYVNWLYEFGSLFGLLDDIVDYEDDIKFNRANSFMHNGSGTAGIECADINNLIAKVLQIRKYWIDKVPYWFGVNDEVKYSLVVCMISWIGGYISRNVNSYQN